jgi:hypothetical protein
MSKLFFSALSLFIFLLNSLENMVIQIKHRLSVASNRHQRHHDRQTHTADADLFLDPALVTHLDRFPRQPDMALFALHSKCTIMPVILFVATDTTGRLGQFGA